MLSVLTVVLLYYHTLLILLELTLQQRPNHCGSSSNVL